MASTANVEQIATEMSKPKQRAHVKNSRKASLEGVDFTVDVDACLDYAHITACENDYGFMFSSDEMQFSDKFDADAFAQQFYDPTSTVTLNWLNNKKESLLLTLSYSGENNEPFIDTHELHDNVYPNRKKTDVNLSSILDALKTNDLVEMKQSFASLANEFNSFRGIYIGRN